MYSVKSVMAGSNMESQPFQASSSHGNVLVPQEAVDTFQLREFPIALEQTAAFPEHWENVEAAHDQLRHVFGRAFFALRGQLRQPQPDQARVQQLIEEINANATQFLAQEYKVPEDFQEQYIRTKLQEAEMIAEYIRQRFVPRNSDRFKGPNEVYGYTGDIFHDRVHLLAGEHLLGNPNKRITPDAQFHVSRQLFLANLAMLVEKKRKSQRSHKTFRTVTEALAQHFWEGDYGQRHRIDVTSFYDEDTNTPLFYKEDQPFNGWPAEHFCVVPPGIRPNSITQKRHWSEVRLATIGGHKVPVLYEPREKSTPSETVKALRDAFDPDEWEKYPNKRYNASPWEQVDTIGLSFTLFTEEEAQLQEFFESLMERLGNTLPLIRAQDKHKMYKEQPGRFDYMRKVVELDIDGKPCPFEIMVRTFGSALRQRYQIKKSFDSITFDGHAHALYEIDRMRNVIPWFFPQSVFGPINYQHYLQTRMGEVASELQQEKNYAVHEFDRFFKQ